MLILRYIQLQIMHYINNIPSMNIHEHSKNVIGQLLLAE